MKTGRQGADKRKSEAQTEDEERFLEQYRPGDFARPSVTVDLVIFTVIDKLLHVLFVRRNEHPFKGRWALPGGFVRVSDGRKDQGEDLDAAAQRELLEETGLSHTASGNVFLEQVRTFGRPGRDPRMRVISVAYYALVRPTLVPLIRAGGDVSHAKWFDVTELAGTVKARSELAFDHAEILDAALDRMRADLDRTGIAFELVPETFTIQELRAVHEAIRGEPLDPGNFRKRFLRLIEDGVIEPARGKRATVSKPASVYRFVRRVSPYFQGLLDGSRRSPMYWKRRHPIVSNAAAFDDQDWVCHGEDVMKKTRHLMYWSTTILVGKNQCAPCGFDRLVEVD